MKLEGEKMFNAVRLRWRRARGYPQEQAKHYQSYALTQALSVVGTLGGKSDEAPVLRKLAKQFVLQIQHEIAREHEEEVFKAEKKALQERAKEKIRLEKARRAAERKREA